jgi:hypothetical protein
MYMGFELLRSLEIKEDLGQKGEENTYGQNFFSLNFTTQILHIRLELKFDCI